MSVAAMKRPIAVGNLTIHDSAFQARDPEAHEHGLGERAAALAGDETSAQAVPSG